LRCARRHGAETLAERQAAREREAAQQPERGGVTAAAMPA
jgi:hypothetical protein